MTIRDQVLAAFEDGNVLAIRRLGWWPPYEAANEWWAPKQRCTLQEFVPYVKLLGDEEPAAVVDAFRDLAGEWRPHPAAIRGHIHRNDTDHALGGPGLSRDPASDPEALQAVATAARNGARLCDCGCPTSRTWRINAAGLLRCRDCDGLERGQVYSAEDAGLIKEAA